MSNDGSRRDVRGRHRGRRAAAGAQQRVRFKQLIAVGITKEEIGKHVARDGTCWIFFAELAARVLVDAETRATIIDPSRLPL